MVSTAPASDRLMAFGRLFFGIGLIAWGIQHLVAGDFVTRVVPGAWTGVGTAGGGRTLAAYIVGIVLVGAGAAIVSGIKARAAAWTFGAVALVSLLIAHLPLAIAGPAWGGTWTAAGKALVMCGGAIAVAVSFSRTGGGMRDRARVSDVEQLAGGEQLPEWLPDADRLMLIARLCLAAFLVLAGIQHFLFAPFVATLVPAWMPGALFWTYLGGVALIAGGVGISGAGRIIAPHLTMLAALCAGAMIFSWVFLVHIPRALAQPGNHGELAAVFEALAFSGVAFLLAGFTAARAR